MPGKIWEVDYTSGKVWLVVSEATPRLRRKILLAIDRSDSTAGSEASLRAAATELARALDLGDVVVLWRMGESNPALEFEIKSDTSRNDLVQKVMKLAESNNGSWISETWGEMHAVSSHSSSEFASFILLFSDGEIFDAGALGARGNIPLQWYRLHGGEGVATSEFRSWAQECEATAEGFKKDLAIPALTVRLQIKAHGVQSASLFDEKGRLTSAVPLDQLAQFTSSRVVLVGGKVQSACLNYTAGHATMTDSAFEWVHGGWPQEPELQAVLIALGGDHLRWDKQRVQQLATGKPRFRCRFDDRESQPGQLFCAHCDCCLLTIDRKWSSDIYPLRWKFPLLDDGRVGEAIAVEEGEAAGQAVTVTNDQDGAWLTLDLGAD